MSRIFDVDPNLKILPPDKEGRIEKFEIKLNSFDLERGEAVTVDFTPKQTVGSGTVNLVSASDCKCSPDNTRKILCTVEISSARKAENFFNIELSAASLGDVTYTEMDVFRVIRREEIP